MNTFEQFPTTALLRDKEGLTEHGRYLLNLLTAPDIKILEMYVDGCDIHAIEFEIARKPVFVVHFEDKGQDCLGWVVDGESGVICQAFPFQNSIWAGLVVDLESLETGLCPIVNIDGDMRELDFVIQETITENIPT